LEQRCGPVGWKNKEETVKKKRKMKKQNKKE
jgi:hypothetical protein